MIQFLKNNEINKLSWDACISGALQSICYGFSWYLDAVAPTWGGVVRESENGYDVILPVAFGKKFGVAYVYPPFFTQQLGIFSLNELTKEEFAEVWRVLCKEFRYIEYAFNTQNNFHESLSGEKRNRQTFHLDLSAGGDEIREGYSTNRKRDIKKAEKNKLILVPTEDVDAMISFFRRNKGIEIQDLVDEDYARLKTLYSQASNTSQAEIYFATSPEGRLLAGGLFLVSKKHVIFLMGTTNEEGKEKRAMTFLMDGVIQLKCSSLRIFDFEGSDIESLAKFYSSFGAEKRHYTYTKLNHLRPPFSWLKN